LHAVTWHLRKSDGRSGTGLIGGMEAVVWDIQRKHIFVVPILFPTGYT
jgi:hypothetical protein